MAGHEKREDRASLRAREHLNQLGNEVRHARLASDLSQTAAGAAIARSGAWWSRMERGELPQLSVADVGRAFAVVGMDLHIRGYPAGPPLRDKAHVELLERFRRCLHSRVDWRTEVPLPNVGDRRAWDALIRVARIRIGVEAETRARDAQALQRRLGLKRRDGGVDHLVLLLADTRSNRAFLRAAGAGLLLDFPIPGQTALARLAAGIDPGGSAIIRL